MATRSRTSHKATRSRKGTSNSFSPAPKFIPVVQSRASTPGIPATVNAKTSPAETDISTMPSIPKDLTEFENTNLVHQKRLKVNNSQITRVTFEFSELKARYLTTWTTPPTTTAAFRDHILSQLKGLCTRHAGLLNVRRKMLEHQQYWLENGMQVQPIQDSDRLLMAIDTQIEAADDLAQRQSQGALMQQLAWV